MNENTLGGSDVAFGTIGLAIAILLVILAVFWVLFPILVWQQLRDLNKTISAQLRELRIITALITPNTRAELQPDSEPAPPPPPLSHRCEFCSVVMEYTPDASGTTSACPNCGNDVTLP